MYWREATGEYDQPALVAITLIVCSFVIPVVIGVEPSVHVVSVEGVGSAGVVPVVYLKVTPGSEQVKVTLPLFIRIVGVGR